MIKLDDELAKEYLCESREHLATMETDLLAIERGGGEFDRRLANRVFRAVHAVRAAGFFDLMKIRQLAHRAEEVMALICSDEMVPKPNRVRILLRATHTLRELILHPGESNHADIAEIMAALGKLYADHAPSSRKLARRVGWRLRVLVVEDDFASRLLLRTFLSRYGDCEVAVNGWEAVEASRMALERGQKFDLICMDIMMPEMDGREAVRQVRALEEAHGIFSDSGARIIMTTTVTEMKEVIRCFQELCDAYLMKPIDLSKLLGLMKSYQLVR